MAPTQGQAAPTQRPGQLPGDPRPTRLPGTQSTQRTPKPAARGACGFVLRARGGAMAGWAPGASLQHRHPLPSTQPLGSPLGSWSHGVGTGRCAGSEIDGAVAGVAVVLLDPRLDVRQLLLQVFAALLLLQEGRILPAAPCSAGRNPATAPRSCGALGTPPQALRRGERHCGEAMGLQPPSAGSRTRSPFSSSRIHARRGPPCSHPAGQKDTSWNPGGLSLAEQGPNEAAGANEHGGAPGQPAIFHATE